MTPMRAPKNFYLPLKHSKRTKKKLLWIKKSILYFKSSQIKRLEGIITRRCKSIDIKRKVLGAKASMKRSLLRFNITKKMNFGIK